MGGPYPSRLGALKREHQVQFYKNKTASLGEIKMNEFKKEKTYPMTRGFQTSVNIVGAGLPGFIASRNLIGRAITGAQGITVKEQALLDLIRKSPEFEQLKASGKTYPISRFLRSVPGAAGLGAVEGEIVGGIFTKNPLGIVGGAVGGAGGGALGQLVNRALYSRAAVGRGKINRGGFYKHDPIIYGAGKQVKMHKQAQDESGSGFGTGLLAGGVGVGLGVLGAKHLGLLQKGGWGKVKDFFGKTEEVVKKTRKIAPKASSTVKRQNLKAQGFVKKPTESLEVSEAMYG